MTMIRFVVECSSFQAAASVEKVLKEQSIRYTVDTNGSPKTPNRRRHVTAKEFANIKNKLKMYPNKSDSYIGDLCGVSSNTVWRVRHGEHPLCKGSGKR